MTVPVQFPFISHTASGSSATFAFDYLVIQKADLRVTVGGSVLTQNDFSVTGLGEDNGGTVTLVAGNPVAGTSVIIQRSIPLSREIDYQQSGEFRAVTVNADFDRIWQALQDGRLDTNGAIRYPSIENLDGTLPGAGTRAQMLLGFDPNGYQTLYPVPASVGAGDIVVDQFVDGVDFTAGITTVLTLSRPPGNPSNLEVFFDALYQGPDQWVLVGTTLTFSSPIPVGVSKVFARIGTTLSTLIPAVGSVGDAQIVWSTILSRDVDNIVALRQLDKSKYKRAQTFGYYVPGDLGDGTYWLDDSDSTSPENGGTVIVGIDGGRWKLVDRDRINVRQFGAKGDGITDDTAKIQAAVDATPNGGELYFPYGKYIVTSEVTLLRPITIRGSGPGSVTAGISGGSDTDNPTIKQTGTTKSIFKMVARLGNYAFGTYGILGMNFFDLQLEGNAIGSRSVSAITTDTTVNGGEYHIRHCHFNNVLMRFFQRAIDLTGISYLNVFIQCQFYWSDTGFYSAKGSSTDVGAGQTRFIGCTFDQMNGACASLNMDSQGGSFSFTDCTISESLGAISMNSHASLTVTGCMFESILNSGAGACIYIKMDSSATLNHDSQKVIVGNQFLTSDYAIVIDKFSTLGALGTFSFPCLIDGNSFTGISNKTLQINLRPGDLSMSAKNFVFGPSNSGTNAGFVADSDISTTTYAGLDLRKFTFKRRFAFNNAPLAASFLVLPVGVVVTKARAYFTANASVSTGFSLGDQSDGGRYINALNAQTATLNQWYGWQDTPPQVIVGGTMNLLQTSFTAGANGAAGIVEIEYYVP